MKARTSVLAAFPILVILGFACFFLPHSYRDLSGPHAGAAATLQQAVQVPFAFEPNRGQVAAPTQFFSPGRAYTVHLAGAGAELRLGQGERPEREALLEIRPRGAREGLQPVGTHPLPGTRNYYLGSDPDRWVTGVPTYAQVKVPGVYPGIDLVYRTDEEHLEYDYIVTPGAEPERIRIAFAGARAKTLDPQGNLVLTVADREVVQKAPVAYQLEKGRRQAVAAGHELHPDGTVGFKLGSYDRNRPLVIDPVLVYSTLAGGSESDSLYSMTRDGAGNIWATGVTSSTDFEYPGFPGLKGTADVWIGKFSSAGTLLTMTFLGGNGIDQGTGITLDSQGQVYVGGSSNSAAGFPTLAGCYQATNQGDFDWFLVKLDAAGTLTYSTLIGGADWEICQKIALAPPLATGGDPTVYLAGRALTGFPTTTGAFQESNNSELATDEDVVLVQFDPQGNGAGDLVYSTYLGGSGRDGASDLAVDGAGKAYIGGYTSFYITGAHPFPITDDAFQPLPKKLKRNQRQYFRFLTVLHPGHQGPDDLVYSTFLNYRSATIYGYPFLALDEWGRVYLTGYCREEIATTAGAFDESYNGGEARSWEDTFLMILDPSIPGPAALLYSTYFGGYTAEHPEAIAVRGATATTPGQVYLAGWLRKLEAPPEETAPVLPFPLTADTFLDEPLVLGGDDTWVAVFDPGGNGANDLLFSVLIGGTDGDYPSTILVDESGAILVGGRTRSVDFPITPGSQAYHGTEPRYEAFLLKILTDLFLHPGNLEAAAKPGCEIDLTWVEASDEAGFAIERSEDGLHWTEVHRTAADVTAWTDSGLTANTTYHYRVRAFKAEGYSGYSNRTSATAITTVTGQDYYAIQDLPVTGTVTGTYLDTRTADSVYQTITEVETSHPKPDKRITHLEHQWLFNVSPGATSMTFHLKARRPDNSEGDDFIFAWSTNGSDWTNLVTVVSADDSQELTAPMPVGLSGNVVVRVTDTDTTKGNLSHDRIEIDHMFIKTE